jgi:hypothetical protein
MNNHVKTVANTILLVLLLILVQNGFSQGLVNLTFESANVLTIPSGQPGASAATTHGLPNWNGFIGSTQQT